MKLVLLVFTLVLMLGTLPGCIAVPRESYTVSPQFDRSATLKVVNIETTDIVYGQLEHYLLDAGFQLVSDNQLRGTLPAGQAVISTIDTTFSVINQQAALLSLFPGESADYVLRYQYALGGSFSKLAFTQLNITVVDRETARPVASYHFRQAPLGWGKQRAEKTLTNFARQLSGKAE